MKLPLEVAEPLVLCFILVLLLVWALSFVFRSKRSSVGSTDGQGQAFGWPEGSVRALLAILLVSIYLIVALQVLGTAFSTTSTLEEIPTEQMMDMVKSVPHDSIQSVKLAAATVVGADGKTTAQARYTIVLRGTDQVRKELSEQVLGAIGALVISIVSFYFGAKTSITAVNAGSTAATKGVTTSTLKPTISQITPQPALTTAAQPVDLQITGANLSKVSKAALTGGSGTPPTITITPVDANSVSAKISLIPGNVGAYSLVVTTSDGQSSDGTPFTVA